MTVGDIEIICREFARITWKIVDFCVHAATALRINC